MQTEYKLFMSKLSKVLVLLTRHCRRWSKSMLINVRFKSATVVVYRIHKTGMQFFRLGVVGALISLKIGLLVGIFLCDRFDVYQIL